VEAGIAYGGNLPKEDKVEILRFANRVPLLYQQGACAITHAIENLSWRTYSLNQPGGSIPIGPAIILVHVASTHIPFTSESKEAIADVPEIIAEVELALKDVARRLKLYLSRQDNLEKRREKEEIINVLLPRIAKKVGEILERPTPDITPIVAKIMRNVFCQRVVRQNGNGCEVEIRLKNHGDSTHHFVVHEMLPYRQALSQKQSLWGHRLIIYGRYLLSRMSKRPLFIDWKLTRMKRQNFPSLWLRASRANLLQAQRRSMYE
jgi:DNA topoisomerase-6 subunit B